MVGPDQSDARGHIGRLLARLRPEAPSVAVPTEPDELPVAGSEVDFGAYAEDCRIFGFVRLEAERLTDALNESDSVALVDVLVVSLEDGHAVPLRSLTVRREDLLAVRASGPRGNPARRRRTRGHPVIVTTGPYVIRGYLHGPPTSDPLLGLRHRRPMVPLTEAWISYTTEGRAHRGRVGTLIVNRELMDWMHLARDDEVRSPSLPVEPRPDPRAKDLTGYLRA